jgi:hypothetical protein
MVCVAGAEGVPGRRDRDENALLGISATTITDMLGISATTITTLLGISATTGGSRRLDSQGKREAIDDATWASDGERVGALRRRFGA